MPTCEGGYANTGVMGEESTRVVLHGEAVRKKHCSVWGWVAGGAPLEIMHSCWL